MFELSKSLTCASGRPPNRRSLTVAAASVLAKTARDALMRALDSEYPGYVFARHKGYGTPQHRAALAGVGMCSIHRKSFNIKHDQNLPQGSDPSLHSGQALREVDFRLAWMLLGGLTARASPAPNEARRQVEARVGWLLALNAMLNARRRALLFQYQRQVDF